MDQCSFNFIISSSILWTQRYYATELWWTSKSLSQTRYLKKFVFLIKYIDFAILESKILAITVVHSICKVLCILFILIDIAHELACIEVKFCHINWNSSTN
jgi:hypothetical protein